MDLVDAETDGAVAVALVVRLSSAILQPRPNVLPTQPSPRQEADWRRLSTSAQTKSWTLPALLHL